MKTTVLWTLVGINALLLICFIGRVSRDNAAIAQPANRGVRPGDYLMIPGDVTGGRNGIVYVIDTTNQRLSAVAYNDTAQAVDVMPSIDLARVFAGQITPDMNRR